MSTNGWGKGSVNNTNGWGAGAINNDNGWGDSQLRSWSGDTDLDGGTGIPINTVAPVISGTTTLGSVLTTTNGTWTAKPAATFTYQWKRNGSNIVGATNSTYTIVVADSAANITCEVTATNDFGSAAATSNTITAQTYQAPVNTVAPAITGTAQENQTLTCSQGTWTGTPTITYAYQWKRNGSSIIGANTNSYLLGSFDVGQSIKCTVTATNSVGNTNADSNTVTPTSAVDADAQAFVTNAGIVDQVEANAVNNLVIGLKADGLWSKMKAIYPFVGSSASSHKYNLKNPLDTDAAFRLVFNGGWTHSANGALPNGTNAFADTKLNISLQPNWVSNNHLSFYSRTQALSGSGWNMGVGNASNGLPLFGVAAVRSGNLAIYDSGNFPSDRVTMVQTDGRGYWLGSTTALNLRKFIKNGGNVIVTNTNTTTAIASNANIFLGALNNTNGSDFFMSQEFAFSSIGDGLTDTEASNFYTRVQAFNTTLNRQV
ncbi:hypothetical protein UFOVP425_48 [uncultured Caudovirales phage]|uniref:Ig-like domain-containing protein n=1 Tax=uncultured Caudovirales phage TaxID=2100421 RepID=A0A6J5M7M6_9CAUD|nr:hypothetical protein UFOVP425_48 [uncultured Caudovirales phage]